MLNFDGVLGPTIILLTKCKKTIKRTNKYTYYLLRWQWNGIIEGRSRNPARSKMFPIKPHSESLNKILWIFKYEDK